MKNVGLLVFLAAQDYSISTSLSMIEWNFVIAYYYETAMPLIIISCHNSKMSDNLQSIVINVNGVITFGAIIRKMVSCLIWILDNLKQSRYLEHSRTSSEISVNKNLRQFERNFFSNNI